MKYLLIMVVFLSGCSVSTYKSPMQPVYDYSRTHHVTCKLRNFFDYDQNLQGGEVVNGQMTPQTQDAQYICSDGKIITVRFTS